MPHFSTSLWELRFNSEPFELKKKKKDKIQRWGYYVSHSPTDGRVNSQLKNIHPCEVTHPVVALLPLACFQKEGGTSYDQSATTSSKTHLTCIVVFMTS